MVSEGDPESRADETRDGHSRLKRVRSCGVICSSEKQVPSFNMPGEDDIETWGSTGEEHVVWIFGDAWP